MTPPALTNDFCDGSLNCNDASIDETCQKSTFKGQPSRRRSYRWIGCERAGTAATACNRRPRARWSAERQRNGTVEQVVDPARSLPKHRGNSCVADQRCADRRPSGPRARSAARTQDTEMAARLRRLAFGMLGTPASSMPNASSARVAMSSPVSTAACSTARSADTIAEASSCVRR